MPFFVYRTYIIRGHIHRSLCWCGCERPTSRGGHSNKPEVNENMASKRKRVLVEMDDDSSTMEHEEPVQTIPAPNISRIRNKQLRTEMYREMKREKRKVSDIKLLRCCCNLVDM